MLSWPHWHWAVLLLYGGHIALNQLGNVVKAGDDFKMDYGSTSDTKITDMTIKHAHCWHTEQMFSKFQFGAGNYDKEDFTQKGNMDTTTD